MSTNPEPALHPSHPAHASFLLLLLAGDLFFIGIHAVHSMTPYLHGHVFSLNRDRGCAEMYQYAKELAVCIALFSVYRKTRQPAYWAWAALFGYLLLDDSIGLHERVSKLIPPLFASVPWPLLRDSHFGEVLFLGAVGSVLLILIIWTTLRSTRNTRWASRDLCIILAVLVFFGVIADYLVTRAPASFRHSLLGATDDIGEMLAMSVAVWYVFTQLERRARLESPVFFRRSEQGSGSPMPPDKTL